MVKISGGRVALLFLTVALLSLYVAMARDPSLALWLDRTAGAPLRACLSALFGGIPFSVTEWLLASLPFLLLFGVLLAFFAARSAAATRRAVALFLVPAVAVLGLYALTFAAGRHIPPIEERLSLSDGDPSTEEIIGAAAWLSALAAEPPEYPGDAAVQASLCAAYRTAGGRYGFAANTAVVVKETATPLLLRLGYFGLYAFPLGEITLVTECPPASRTFTLAHEMAHASGFAREEEADLVALLAALSSKDAYLTSAVAEGILGRFLLCLSYEAPAVWQEVSRGLSPAAREEISRAGDILSEGQAAEALATEVPDYSKTVRLTVALYRRILAQGEGDASIL